MQSWQKALLALILLAALLLGIVLSWNAGTAHGAASFSLTPTAEPTLVIPTPMATTMPIEPFHMFMYLGPVLGGAGSSMEER